jgi:hypothetical protein
MVETLSELSATMVASDLQGMSGNCCQHNELQRACLHEHLLHDCFRGARINGHRQHADARQCGAHFVKAYLAQTETPLTTRILRIP